MDEQKKFSLKKDPSFGFFRISPTPTIEEISKYYADEFYSGDYKKLNDSSLEVQLEDPEFYNGFRDDVFEILIKYLPDKGKIDLLDVGCGWGQNLLYFREKGFICHGFDPAQEAVEYAQKKGLNVVKALFEKMDVFGKRFDVVTLFNVLEHLADPVKVLSEIKKTVLKPGGLIVIDVPNEFNDFQTVGQTIHNLNEWWVAPPAHLNYFSNTTLKNLLMGTGYEVLQSQSSFPLEMFLLFGKKYVGNPTLGRQCHLERVAFETNLRKNGKKEKLNAFYQALASLDLGRQVVMFAKSV